MITTKLTTITPALAEEYLKSNIQNRTVRWAHVETLKQDILAGRFLTTHQGIAFASDGSLVDGQHRLLAIKASGREVPLLVTRGVDPHVNGNVDLFAMDVIDTGKSRSAADQLNLLHGVSNSNLTVGALRVIAVICAPHFSKKGGLNISRAIPMLSIYGKEIEAVLKIGGPSKVTKKAAVVAVLSMGMKIDSTIATEFMQSLATGEDIKSGDPVYAIREHIISKGVGHGYTDRNWFMEALANAFYNTMKGGNIRVLKGGTQGLDFLRQKQRTNVERVRAIVLGER